MGKIEPAYFINIDIYLKAAIITSSVEMAGNLQVKDAQIEPIYLLFCTVALYSDQNNIQG